MIKATLNGTKLNKAINKVQSKVIKADGIQLLKLNKLLTKLNDINTVNKVLNNNKRLTKINLNQLILAKKKALKKGLNELKLNNINFYLILVEDIQMYKSRIVQKYQIILN